jgi:hypothetical protein
MISNNTTSSDLPITALCIVADRQKCPTNYFPVYKCYDVANMEVDLWKDSLFGKKINRFICFTKDYPIAEVIVYLIINCLYFRLAYFLFCFLSIYNVYPKHV